MFVAGASNPFQAVRRVGVRRGQPVFGKARGGTGQELFQTLGSKEEIAQLHEANELEVERLRPSSLEPEAPFLAKHTLVPS